MSIAIKRAYESPAPADGHRVLVDRLWPRGVSREQLEIEEWLREIAPSDRLRKALHAGDMGWGEFRRAYLSELSDHRGEVEHLVPVARHGRLTLVYGARDPAHNNAVVLKQYLKMLGAD